MTDNKIEFRTVSQCISSDWCEGYNEAAKLANEVISCQQKTIEDLQKAGKLFANTVRENAQKACEVTVKKEKEDAAKEIDLLKKLVESAIYHGGDGGGPYYSYGDELKECMEEYFKYRGWDKDYQVSGELDDMLTFEKVEKEPTVDLVSQISK